MSRKMKDSGIEWIGEIPEAWEVGRLKHISSNEKYSIVDGPFGSAINTRDYVDKGIPLIRITNLKGGSVSPESMVYIMPNHAKQLERSAVKINDIIVAKTGATVGKCAINESIEYGILSSSCIKITVNNTHNNRYFYYLMCTDQFRDALINSCNGTTRDTINLTPFSNLNITIPNIHEQQKIANFLDQKVSQIDHIIEKTKESIEEYKKYKQSLITEIVTKGLSPDVKMKDSGIEWIGEIPKHWEVGTLSQLYSQVKNKNKDLLEKNLLSLSYGKIIRRDIDKRDGLLPESFDSYNIVENGDIILRLTDLQNDKTSLRVGLCTQKGIITSAYISLRKKYKGNDEYVYYYLHSFDIYKGFYGMGSGVRQNLTFDGIKYLQLLLPPEEEQQQIATYLDSKCNKIDKLITQKEKLITELESYKKSLIYEYVTGKKEVL